MTVRNNLIHNKQHKSSSNNKQPKIRFATAANNTVGYNEEKEDDE